MFRNSIDKLVISDHISDFTPWDLTNFFQGCWVGGFGFVARSALVGKSVDCHVADKKYADCLVGWQSLSVSLTFAMGDILIRGRYKIQMLVNPVL